VSNYTAVFWYVYMVSGFHKFRGKNENFLYHDEGNSGVNEIYSVEDVEDLFLQG